LFFNLYILSLDFSSDTLGLIRSATPLAALVLGLPMGLLSDRIGRRKSMIIGLSIGFIGMFFQVHVLNAFLIFLFGLVQGAGFMLYQVSQLPFIMDITKKENQALVFSLNFGLLTLAAMIGNIAAGQAPQLLARFTALAPGSPEAYRWVITGGIFLAATSLIPILLIPKPRLIQTQSPQRVPMKVIITRLTANPVVRQLAIINLITGFGAALLIPYFNVFMKGKFLMSDDLLGFIFSLTAFFVFIGSLSTPWLVKRSHSRIIPTVFTQAISIIFLFVLGFTPLLWLAAVSFIFRAVFMQMSAPLVDNFAMLISKPEEQGSIASIRGIGWQMGQAIGIFASGFVQSRYGFSPLFITTGLLYVVAIILTWVYFRPQEKDVFHVGKT
jgi:MFS family permease